MSTDSQRSRTVSHGNLQAMKLVISISAPFKAAVTKSCSIPIAVDELKICFSRSKQVFLPNTDSAQEALRPAS
ncbi:hypothetical protein KSP39_PZI021071 [Platanthera zijinensis]|uniref:Uncharacterized protein n=1 Tax=Platanthera zijinensis TaxID=2320716 RepID=A0AAP0FWG0_9ASPA